MKCPKCKATIDNDSKYCTYCGILINKDNIEKKENITKEKLLDAFIGNNSEEIKEKSFSLPQVLLGTIYLLYRKMYLYALISIIIFIGSLFLSKYFILIIVIRNIVFAFYFNTIYYNHANNKVNDIMKMSIDDTSKEKLCKKKGGTSIIPIIIGFSSTLAIGVVLILVGAAVLITSDNNLLKNYISDKPELYNLKYTVPDKFQTTSFNDKYSKYYSYMDDDYNYCSFTISQNDFTSLYPTTEKFLKSSAVMTANETVSDVKKVTINNYEWQGLIITSQKDLKYIYATKKDDRYYSIDFTTDKEGQDPCLIYYKQVLNSLEFK